MTFDPTSEFPYFEFMALPNGFVLFGSSYVINVGGDSNGGVNAHGEEVEAC